MSDYLTREEKNLWRDQIINSRFSDFKDLKIWLKEKNIEFKDTNTGIELRSFDISTTLKVKFINTRKQYQYNLDGIKKRILEDIH